MSSFLSNKSIPGQSIMGRGRTDVWLYLTFASLWQCTGYVHVIPLLSKTRAQTLSLNIISHAAILYI